MLKPFYFNGVVGGKTKDSNTEKGLAISQMRPKGRSLFGSEPSRLQAVCWLEKTVASVGWIYFFT